MDTLTPQTLSKLFKALPQDVRDIYSSDKTTEALITIGKKYSVHIDKLGGLVDETGFVLLGKTHPKDYIRNISARLNLKPEDAKSIAEEINEQIFKPLRESLKQIHHIETPGEPPAVSHRQKEPSQKAEPTRPQEKEVENGGIKVSAREKNVPANKKSDFAIAVEKKIAATQAPVGIPHSKDEDVLPKTEETEKIKSDIIKDKLTTKFQIPQEDSSHEAIESEEKEAPKTKPEVTSYDVDPYREPID